MSKKDTSKIVQNTYLKVTYDEKELGAYVANGEFRKEVLRILVERPCRMRDIGKELGRDLSQVCRCVNKELIPYELVTCTTPNAVRGKIFKASDLGKDIYMQLVKNRIPGITPPSRKLDEYEN